MEDYGYLFNNEIIDSTREIKGRISKIKNKKTNRLLARKQNLREIWQGIEKDNSYHIISSDSFGSIELLNVIKEDFKKFDKLNISTWSYNDEFVKIIEECNKDNTELFLCTDKSMRGRKPHLYAQMATLNEKYSNMTFKVHKMIHSKITLIKIKEYYITIEASANYSNNQRVENFTITENKELFIFHKDWMNEIINQNG